MSEFEATMAKVNQQMVIVDRKIGELFSKGGNTASIAPPPIDHWIDELLKQISELVSKMWNEIKLWVENPGNPPALFNASKVLHDKVQAKTSSQAGKIVETYLQVDDHWTGDAADAYKKVIKPDAPQTLAVKQYGSTVGAVATALDTCGWTIIGYWVALAAAYATLIGALVAACIGVVTVVGAIPALIYIASCIGGFLVTAGVATITCVTIMASQSDTFRNQNDGNDNFPDAGNGPSWPPSGVPTD